jgi:arginine decarboxylase
MEIFVTTGTGEGPTAIAAFDAALIDAGVENYNLIYLSSVIPAGSIVRRGKYSTPPDEFGYRLYVVMSRHDELHKGKMAWAGVGWTQTDNGRGLFVELHGSTRSQVEGDIQATLASMTTGRPFPFGSIESDIAGIECRDKPVCALAIAVFQSAGWKT